jgi:hypothetical protein
MYIFKIDMISRGRRILHACDPCCFQAQYIEYLRDKAIPDRLHGKYKKWLRYYLDFCRKYHFPSTRKESLPRFISKLQEKKKRDEQRRQAQKAIILYYEIVKQEVLPEKRPVPHPAPSLKYPESNKGKHASLREASSRPATYQKVTQRSSQVSDPPSRGHGPGARRS